MTAYRALANVARLTAFVAAFAHSVRAQEATIPASLFGELRVRGEWDQPGGALHADLYTYLRTRLGVRATPVKGVTVVAQVQDSRVFGAESNTTSTNPDVI